VLIEHYTQLQYNYLTDLQFKNEKEQKKCIWDFSVFKKILTHTFKVTKNEKILYNKLKNNEDIEIVI